MASQPENDVVREITSTGETPTPGYQMQLEDKDKVSNLGFYFMVLRSLVSLKEPTLLPKSFNDKLVIATVGEWLCYFYPYNELKL